MTQNCFLEFCCVGVTASQISRHLQPVKAFSCELAFGRLLVPLTYGPPVLHSVFVVADAFDENADVAQW